MVFCTITQCKQLFSLAVRDILALIQPIAPPPVLSVFSSLAMPLQRPYLSLPQCIPQGLHLLEQSSWEVPHNLWGLCSSALYGSEFGTILSASGYNCGHITWVIIMWSGTTLKSSARNQWCVTLVHCVENSGLCHVPVKEQGWFFTLLTSERFPP